MTEYDLFVAWAAGKRVDLTSIAVTGVGYSLDDLYREARTQNEFDLKDDPNHLVLFKASLYLLYRKFYSQLHKRNVKKGTTITGTTGRTMTVEEETNESENGKLTKAATIKKKVVSINNQSVVTVFPQPYARLLAKGFFPIGFVSKLFVFTSVPDGSTLRAKIATAKGEKEIQFVQKIAKGADYAIVSKPKSVEHAMDQDTEEVSDQNSTQSTVN